MTIGRGGISKRSSFSERILGRSFAVTAEARRKAFCKSFTLPVLLHQRQARAIKRRRPRVDDFEPEPFKLQLDRLDRSTEY